MKKFLTSKKGIVLLATSVAAVVAAMGAYAYFTTTGAGDGTATVGTSSALVLYGTAPTNLYPGGPSRTVSFTVDNSSPGNQWIENIHLVNVTTDGAHSACNMSDFTMPDVTAQQNFPSGNGQAVTATGQITFATTGTRTLARALL